jgi:predicted ATP-grasp superfamily ATP-dependent carboligase
MNSNKECGVVVVGGSIPGLSTVRALANRGIPIVVVVTRPNEIAHYSRWIDEYHALFNFYNQPESLLNILELKSKRWSGWSILCTNDHALTVLSQNRDRLSRWFNMTVPPWEITHQLLRKDLIYRTAQKVGVDIAHSYGNATRVTINDTDISFPVVVKPIESHYFVEYFGKKLFVANNKDELIRSIQELEQSGLKAQILDLVPGPDSLFYNYSVYINRRGEPVAELSMRKLRKSPPFFGVCRAAEPSNLTKLREPTLELLRRIGWRGMANAEYKLDPRDGRYRLMEINGRCFRMQGLAWKAGVNYPLLAWKESVSGEEVSASPNGWNGVWLHLHDDFYYFSFFRSIERLRLRQYLSSYCRPKIFAVWSASDPKPFFIEWFQALRSAFRFAYDRNMRKSLHTRVQDMSIELSKLNKTSSKSNI